MSDIGDILSSAQGGQLVANLAQRFGLTDEQMTKAISALTPALSIGLEKAVEEPQSLGTMVSALYDSDSCCAYDQADAAHAEDAVARGQNVVYGLFGSDDTTGQIVQAAARESGVSADILSQLLPVLASILFSGLSKTLNEQGLGGLLAQLGQLANAGAGRGGQQGGGIGGPLGGALGGILEQVLGGGRGPQSSSQRGGGDLLGSVLEQILAGGGAPQQQPRPAPGGGTMGGGAAGGGLGGLLGGILGSLLGGGRRPPQGGGDPVGRGDPLSRGDVGRSSPLDANSGVNGSVEFDQAALQQAIEQIKKTLQVGQNAPARTGGGSELESLLGQLLGKK